MTSAEVIEFMNSNPAMFVATIENNQPRVRGALLYKATEEGVIFHTGKFKALYNQLLANPLVELCFNNFQTRTQVRVSGKAFLTEEMQLKNEIYNHPTRVFLKAWADRFDVNGLAVFTIKELKYTVWTMEKNFEATVYEELV